MQNISNSAPRLVLLVRLMAELQSLGRGSVLKLPAAGEPTLFVQARTSGRRFAVLGVQDGHGRWFLVWDGRQRAIVDGSPAAAHRIAEVDR